MHMLQSLGGMVSSSNSSGGQAIDLGALMAMANTMAQSPQMGPLIDAMMSGGGGVGGGGGMGGVMQGMMSALQGAGNGSAASAAAAAATPGDRASVQQAAATLRPAQEQSLDHVVEGVLLPQEAERWVGVISQDAAAAAAGVNGRSATGATASGVAGSDGAGAGLSNVYLAGGEGADVVGGLAASLGRLGPNPGGA